VKTKALVPVFGSNRILAGEVGKQFVGCSWVGIPCAGGFSEVVHIEASSLVINDAHKAIINLARVAADPVQGPMLWRRLRRTVFHPDMLKECQEICIRREAAPVREAARQIAENIKDGHGLWAASLEWAVAYFVCAWMARNGTAGTKNEFRAGMSMRWKSGGGDSAVRLQSAIVSLREWRTILQRGTFTSMDVLDFLDNCNDLPKHGIYYDPPFPGPGDAYKHTFGETKHRLVAKRLAVFGQTKVVCRFYDVPLIRELYPEPDWTWHHFAGRKQTNDVAPEVLLVNRPRVGS
jgi:DNA adenine methylase